VWEKLDQVLTLRSCKEFPSVWSFVAGCGVPDRMDEAFVGGTGLNLSQELHCADAILGGWLDKGRIEGASKVSRLSAPSMLTRPRPAAVWMAGFDPVLTHPKADFA
jgi:hypothetical protein